MRAGEVLQDGFGRVLPLLRAAVDGLSDEELVHRPDPAANTVAWLVWHAARVQDAQVAPLAGTQEVWTSAGWAERFGLDLPADDTGYGHGPEEVGRVHAPADLLVGYAEEVARATAAYLERLEDDDLDVVVDEDGDPPVTLGVRLVSVLGDDLEHAGQAAYLRGLLERAREA
ncbi:mycothiol transferase [Cellulomonas marina]|uniref:DinB superfamily protein n=1 Tax=Cellulomonas marina TaxID=988821 RepID=A0A1I0V438_9CELL|nr:DUF664 domain-containing protein [Cellulomonas marina]GIG28321.1 hypothetical protein Cma02nite_09210 [Cellulomonas marina]SFA71094.1 Protein of unknown function [Cellulomonas marina]